ncbi:hypothetical protein GCM10010324_03810 [Streptomyces hiroshimensis]|uniref:Uncharacterized protein n=1 Tax=Streptomyces hiroshimensis TaxID=66424 RepID=A0ABQ2Y3S2_9ACTN|nr:hypothetical protein GCM10010324_03810 [Streptomyces hiroshimensis]
MFAEFRLELASGAPGATMASEGFVDTTASALHRYLIYGPRRHSTDGIPPVSSGRSPVSGALYAPLGTSEEGP